MLYVGAQQAGESLVVIDINGDARIYESLEQSPRRATVYDLGF